MNHQQLVTKAIRDIAEGSAADRQPQSDASQSARQRAQDLLPELSRRPQRPGFLSQAEAVAEEFFVAVGRLRPGEKLSDELSVPVRLTDNRETSVSVPRHQTVSQLRQQIVSQTGCGGGVGLMMSGRPLTDDSKLLYDLWQQDGLGCSGGSSPRVIVQLTVRTAGG